MKNTFAKPGLIAVISLAGLAGGACLSGGDSGGGKYGGSVLLSEYDYGGTQYGTAYAEFLTSAGTLAAGQAIDTCFTTPIPVASPTPTLNPIALDAGSTVTLQTASMQIDLTSAGSYYSATPGTLPLGTTWDIILSGGADIPAMTFAGALLLPTAPAAAATVAVPATGEITWTAGGGDAAILLFYDASTAVATCYVHDDGAFTLPADALAALPASGYLLLSSQKNSSITVQGRAVTVFGSAGTLVNYTH